MASIVLADIQKAADKKFGDYEITTDVEKGIVSKFKPALRQPKEIRRKLAEAVDIEARVRAAVEDESIDDDLYDMFKDTFRLTALTKADYTRLEKAVGDDPAVWTQLFNDFHEATLTGEAAPSES